MGFVNEAVFAIKIGSFISCMIIDKIVLSGNMKL
jgi:hypothetical protein